MKNGLYLGADTSNYTTSLSLVKDGKVISNVRRLLPVESGKCGLRQSDAVFFHTRALPELAHELFQSVQYSGDELCAVGVSERPRDAEGSYMPCFLAGVSFASAVSGALGIPLYGFSHQAGHISAGVYSCGNAEVFENTEFFAFHISGGTTEALKCRYDGTTYVCQKLGGTSDASAGQIIDRAGVYSGLDFPCGKELDALALCADKRIKPSVSMKGAYFSLSGLQNKAEKYLSDGESIEVTARFLFESIACALSESLAELRRVHGGLPCLFAGGVMGSANIKNVLCKISDVYFANSELSGDNACGTALLAQKRHTEI